MDSHHPDRLILNAFLPYRLSVLSNRISTAIADLYQTRFDLTVPQWRIIAVLGEGDGLSANQVAERTAMDKVAVSRAVRGLVEAGRLEKRVADDDKRRSVLTLSAEGRTLYEEVVPLAVSWERELLGYLSADARAEIDRALHRLEAATGAMQAP